MTIRGFTFNPFQTNAYVIHDSGEAAIIDPCSSSKQEHEQLDTYIEQEGLRVRHLLLTHAHIDHIFGCRHVAERYGLPIRLHRSDASLLKHAAEQASMFGVTLDAPPEPGPWLTTDETITIGETRWRILETPGHSPGSVSFYSEAERAVIAGDVLFKGSIGRTDLWEGSLPVLMRSIFESLVPLGEDVRVYPGHGPETDIAAEVRSNPFLAEGFSEL